MLNVKKIYMTSYFEKAWF